MRARELKPVLVEAYKIGDRSRPMRARELKRRCRRGHLMVPASRPMRARELKLLGAMLTAISCVAPHAGA